MPCNVTFQGKKSTSRIANRTKVTISQKIVDEYSTEHGTIESQEDGTIKATVMHKDGITVQSEQKFFLCERPGDEDLCAKNGWTAVRGTPEDMISTAQIWATDQYRTYVHSHDNPVQEQMFLR